MSHLLELYAKDLGVQIEHKPSIRSHFVPIPFKNYITIHTSNKVPAKNYSYWSEVVSILKPELEKRGYKIIQVGTQEDPKINGVDLFMNKTSMHQMFFLVENAKCHVGIDSCPVHVASAYNIPTVSLYAHTYESSCKPMWNQSKSKTIESHRNGDRPSYSYNEDPKKIDIIKPEEIANEVFKKLNFDSWKSIKTIYIGDKFLHKTVDVIPVEIPKVNIPEDCKIRVRMDQVFNENILLEILKRTTNKLSIKTDKPISKVFLENFGAKIDQIEYSSKEFDPDFLKSLKSSGIEFRLRLKRKSKLKEFRNKYFNYEIELDDDKKKAKKLKKEIGDKINVGDIKAFSGKFYIIGDKVHTFLGDPKNDLNFWLDLPYFMCYLEEYQKFRINEKTNVL